MRSSFHSEIFMSDLIFAPKIFQYCHLLCNDENTFNWALCDCDLYHEEEQLQNSAVSELEKIQWRWGYFNYIAFDPVKLHTLLSWPVIGSKLEAKA